MTRQIYVLLAVYKVEMHFFFTYKVTIHSGGLKSPTRALERQQNSHLTSSQKTDQQELWHS